MSDDVVWVCENGHIDHLHRHSALDICSRCQDGTCEPRRTLGRRSPEQRAKDKELGIHTPRKTRPQPTRPSSAVRILRPGHDPITVEAQPLSPNPTPPFRVSRRDRTAILAFRESGALPEITFHPTPPAGHPDGSPWPASPGDVVEVTRSVRLVVLGFTRSVKRIVLHYLIEDRRPEPGARLSTKRAPAKSENQLGGPEFAADRDGAAVAAPEITKKVHLAELRKHEQTRDDLGRHLREMVAAPRGTRRGLSLAIDDLERRIGFLRRELGISDKEAA